MGNKTVEKGTAENSKDVLAVGTSYGLKGLYLTADNQPIVLGMVVHVYNEDKEYFGDDEIIDQTVMSMHLEKGFDEYKGEITIGGEDWEGGNLDCYADKTKMAF